MHRVETLLRFERFLVQLLFVERLHDPARSQQRVNRRALGRRKMGEIRRERDRAPGIEYRLRLLRRPVAFGQLGGCGKRHEQ